MKGGFEKGSDLTVQRMKPTDKERRKRNLVVRVLNVG